MSVTTLVTNKLTLDEFLAQQDAAAAAAAAQATAEDAATLAESVAVEDMGRVVILLNGQTDGSGRYDWEFPDSYILQVPVVLANASPPDYATESPHVAYHVAIITLDLDHVVFQVYKLAPLPDLSAAASVADLKTLLSNYNPTTPVGAGFLIRAMVSPSTGGI